jgi:hypothetical protein
MSLTRTFSKYFDSGVRNRGSSYYRSGLVSIKQTTDDLVLATVRGSSNYSVRLQIQDDILEVECNCPYFEDWGTTCKHIWATIIAAENRNYLTDVLSRNITDMQTSDGGFITNAGTEILTSDSSSKYPFRELPKEKPRQPSWEELLNQIITPRKMQYEDKQNYLSIKELEILYILDVPATFSAGTLILAIARRERKQNGDWGKPKDLHLADKQIGSLPNDDDRKIISLLRGAKERYYAYSSSYSDYVPSRLAIPHPLYNILVPQMCQTGRCYLRLDSSDDQLYKVSWDDGLPWEFCLNIRRDEPNACYVIEGSLRRGNDEMPLSKPALLLDDGLVFTSESVGRLNAFGAFSWILFLRKQPSIAVPFSQKDKLLKKILESSRLPKCNLPDELHYEEIKVIPLPMLTIRTRKEKYWNREEVIIYGKLSFNYEGRIITDSESNNAFFQPEQKKLVVRDIETEQTAMGLLYQLGFRKYYSDELVINPKKLPKAVPVLLGKGWHVEAEGKLYRKPGSVSLNITSGIDWFDLNGKVEYDNHTVSLPKLLEALKRGENMVQLGDGSFGILPDEWLKKYGLLAGLGRPQEDCLRFSKTQVCLLDALLAAQPAVQCDEAFARARNELKSFEGIKPENPSPDFSGKLRHYQSDGLGWLIFLQRFGFGGCLADDMGLGKTVQALALLDMRCRQQKAKRPSLVVAPKSVVFNWKEEAARFTPKLKVLDYTGANRPDLNKNLSEYDIIVTTYGTVRRDITALKNIRFDYCILDEAQAIKNEKTASAKASRLLQAENRLALSGTPIENHLGELWSLFEFLNPGMLGSSSVFQLNAGQLRNPDEETRTLLARGLRPFILRRMKSQVAKDLPTKTEQTIYCELDKPQKELYDELLAHYRRTLLKRVSKEGINKTKMYILEALLRLRQAACHPGLVDKSRTSEPSAKLDVLLPQVSEVIEEGHKALVFSQFTSFLSILRDRLNRAKITYEYLDGATGNRAERVERFQKDPDCKLFLISLKAGGLGLNLTSAEYVFLLDPWWNPAVENQAIDRTHRIGQTQPVFAYRLIARNTVEEKVLELQKHKRGLADAIINEDNSLIRKLTREDLELLLS